MNSIGHLEPCVIGVAMILMSVVNQGRRTHSFRDRRFGPLVLLVSGFIFLCLDAGSHEFKRLCQILDKIALILQTDRQSQERIRDAGGASRICV